MATVIGTTTTPTIATTAGTTHGTAILTTYPDPTVTITGATAETTI
jgi:hypothetical protein